MIIILGIKKKTKNGEFPITLFFIKPVFKSDLKEHGKMLFLTHKLNIFVFFNFLAFDIFDNIFFSSIMYLETFMLSYNLLWCFFRKDLSPLRIMYQNFS